MPLGLVVGPRLCIAPPCSQALCCPRLAAFSAGRPMVASVANRPPTASKTVNSQGLFQAVPPPVCQQPWPAGASIQPSRRFHVYVHSNHNFPRHRPDQFSPDDNPTQPTSTNSPTNQLERNAANRLRQVVAREMPRPMPTENREEPQDESRDAMPPLDGEWNAGHPLGPRPMPWLPTASADA
jgi:hypothetical protein